METEASNGNNVQPEKSLDSELKYVEGEELEKTWKSMRRERHKLQENNIWEQFCGDHDVVTTVSSDDPYQFIEDIPEWQIQKLIKIEFEKVANITQNPADVSIPEEIGDGIPMITDEDNVINEEDSNKEEGIKSPLSTVRECASAPLSSENLLKKSPPAEPLVNNERAESNVYYNKIKELREKIIDAIAATLFCLDGHSFENIYSEDITKLKKHATEFCMRFNRVFLYQIQRQIGDVKRHDSHSLPFAKHTHFQAQLLRLTSLHKNILNAFNIFNKTYMQTIMVGEVPNQLRTLIANIQQTTELCIKITEPIDMKIINELYNDDVIPSCNSLEERLIEYEQNFNDVFQNVSKSINNKQQINIKKSQKSVTIQSGYAVNSFKSDVRPKTSKTSTNKTASNVNIKQSKTSNIKPKKPEVKPKCPPLPPHNTNDKGSLTKNNAKKNTRTMRRPLMSFRGSCSPTRKQTNGNNEEIQTLVQSIDVAGPKKTTPRAVKNNTSRKKSITPRTPKFIDENISESTEPNESKQDEDEDDKQNIKLDPGADVSEILQLICKREVSVLKAIRTPKAKNVQLLNIKSCSPRTPSEQLKILDEKIQKKYPKEMATDKLLLPMNPSPELQSHMEQYRRQYLQHMLKSPLYANSNFDKPWDLVARISDNIIDDLICSCSQEMQLLEKITNIYNSEVV